MNKTLCATVAVIGLSATAVQATIHDFDVGWSGASFGNNASAQATLSLDDAFLLNPGFNSTSVDPSFLTSFSVSVSGTAGGAGDGTWGAGDFFDIFMNMDLALDLTQELVGQPQLIDPWGTSQPGGTGGDFNMFSTGADPTAPSGTWFFELSASTGEQMLMTNFTPVPAPSALALGVLAMGTIGRRRRR